MKINGYEWSKNVQYDGKMERWAGFFMKVKDKKDIAAIEYIMLVGGYNSPLSSWVTFYVSIH